jgi:transposase
LQWLIKTAKRAGWVIGYQDETWWSRLKQPQLHSWVAHDEQLRLHELERDKADKADLDPVALCCYGTLRADNGGMGQMLLRFVQGQPVSAATTEYLGWLSEYLAARGAKVLLLVWDNAPWHRSKCVRNWIIEHNQLARAAQRCGKAGLRILVFNLPVKSPWLNPIEPKWVHGKKAIVEPTRKLSADEVRARVYGYFGCEPFESLDYKNVA